MDPHPQKLTVSQLMKRVGAQKIVQSSKSSDDELVSQICYRSSDVDTSSVFCCIPGLKRDGHEFAEDACQRGALALIVDHPLDLDIDQYLVTEPRKAMASSALELYGRPSEQLKLVGITGTNGKTTTCTLSAWIAQKCGLISGTIGTLGAQFNGNFIATDNTTPESVDYQKLLAQGLENGCQMISCEVSSHALALDRVWGSQYEVAAYTNLSQDHLDYHSDMQDYFEAKAKLFWDYAVKERVICVDDSWGQQLLRSCKSYGLKCLSVASSLRSAQEFEASSGYLPSIYPKSIQYDSLGTSLRLVYPLGEIELKVPLIGSFNVQNVCVSFGIALCLGLDAQDIAEALACSPQVPGRLERVGQDYDIAVYVDYAHTPDALEKAMAAVRETKPKRLLLVFGCGGDRDNTKRAPMGEIAAQADIALCTSDNPRTEDPLSIIHMIEEGLIPACEQRKTSYEIEPDRIKAIFRAVELAQSGDAVLIAGKGHEDYQIIGTVKHHMDDREIASDALVEHGSFDQWTL